MKERKDGRVLVIGLDGGTWKVLDPLVSQGKLPFLADLVKTGQRGISLGTVPPLTPSVWTSFVTGVNPGKHKIFGFLNYRGNPERPDFFITRDIAYPTLDKILKQNKKRSYISFTNLTGLIAEAGIETKQMSVDELIKSAEAKVKKLQKAVVNKKMSFAFVLFKEVDVAQHLFWGKPELSDFLVRLDGVIGKLLTYWHTGYPQSAVIVVSDHGFHRAPQLQFSIYPWLAGQGVQPLTWLVLHNLNRYLKKMGINFSRFPPMQYFRQKLVKKTESKVAHTIISHKGIQVSFEGLYVYDPDIDKNKLVGDLKKLRYQGKKVFQFVSLANKVYKGAFFGHGPDIVWLPSPHFHINISPLAEDIFADHPTDVAGDHTADRNGIYIINSPKLTKMIKFPPIVSITDLTAAIYDLLGITKPLGLDGLSPLADYRQLDQKIKKAKAVMTQAYQKFGSKFGVAFTGRKDSTVMVHMLLEVIKEKKLAKPSFLFIDHGQHFIESINFLRQSAKKLNLKMVWQRVKGQGLSASDLAVLKAQALSEAVAINHWRGLASAIRRDENPARRKEKYFSPRDSHTRIHPILDFTERDIWDYLTRFNVPYNPLYDRGYRSLEEKETTKIVTDYSQGERAGRNPKKEKIMDSLRKLGYF